MLTDIWTRYCRLTEQFLENRYRSAKSSAQPQQVLFDAMHYSVSAGGKRLRPFFVMEFCRACGTSPEKAVPVAAAVEMIHTYSLIHDDLPCMDNDDFRRGKPTCHKIYGEANALLAGDALLTDAFRVLASSDLPDRVKTQCVCILSENAGHDGMVGGQVLDISAESRQCTEQDVIDIELRKTGALFRAACCMGVCCAGGTEPQMTAASEYAEALGLAFQIRDDILDVIGNNEKLGKTVGTDENKNTFVRILGIDGAEKLLKQYTEKALSVLNSFKGENCLSEMALYLVDRDY